MICLLGLFLAVMFLCTVVLPVSANADDALKQLGDLLGFDTNSPNISVQDNRSIPNTTEVGEVNISAPASTVSPSDGVQKQYDLDTTNFADIAPHQDGEAILIVEGLSDYTGNHTWTGHITGSNSAPVSYNGSGTDAIIFPCMRYSISFEPTNTFGYVRLHLTDNTGITRFTDKSSLGEDSNEVKLAGVCGTTPDSSLTLIDYLYDYYPLMITKFLDAVDAVREQKEGPINETGSLTAPQTNCMNISSEPPIGSIQMDRL